MYERVLVCTDGSNYAIGAAEEGIGLAKVMDANVIALNVINEVVIAGAIKLGADRREVEAKLVAAGQEAVGMVKKKCDEAGVKVETMVRIGSPANMIIDVANAEKVDLIVMGAHGESGASKLLLGSVVQKVLYWAAIPVLVVK
jgi:nucleotide-binding universal stress UspA family protein